MNLYKASELGKNSGSKKVGPFMVPRSMSSTNSATLATPFKIKGVNYSITSACSTSSHCIGNAYELIQIGKQNIIFAGGGEELHWTLSILFDAMGALSSKYNDLSFMFLDTSMDERVFVDKFNNSSFKFLEIFIDSILFWLAFNVSRLSKSSIPVNSTIFFSSIERLLILEIFSVMT